MLDGTLDCSASAEEGQYVASRLSPSSVIWHVISLMSHHVSVSHTGAAAEEQSKAD